MSERRLGGIDFSFSPTTALTVMDVQVDMAPYTMNAKRRFKVALYQSYSLLVNILVDEKNYHAPGI